MNLLVNQRNLIAIKTSTVDPLHNLLAEPANMHQLHQRQLRSRLIVPCLQIPPQPARKQVLVRQAQVQTKRVFAKL